MTIGGMTMKNETEKHYSDLIKNFDPDAPTKRKSIADSQDIIERMIISGLTLQEMGEVINYNTVSISTFCVKTWGDDYQRKLKKRRSFE